MSDLKIMLRERPASNATEELPDPPRPLLNIEIDDNFKYLNANKLSKDGAIPATLLTFEDLSLSEAPPVVPAGSITYADGKLQLHSAVSIIGTLTVSGDERTIDNVANTTIRYGSESSLDDLLDENAGIHFGNETTPVDLSIVLSGEVNDYYWRFAGASAPSGVEIRAKDFRVINSSASAPVISLVDMSERLDNILHPFDGSYNTFQYTDSLVEAVEKLDQENIPSIKDFVGYTSNWQQSESIPSRLTSLEEISKYIVHDVVTLTSNTILIPAAFNLITGGDGYSLPTTSCIVKVKNTLTTPITIYPADTDTIEGQESISIDVQNLVVTFIRGEDQADWKIM